MRMAEIKDGDTVVLDAGFTCVKAGPITVRKDDRGLYFNCSHGRHYLDGQEDHPGRDLVGISAP